VQERQAILNREKNESIKKQLDEALRQQARERAREIEEERKATVEYMKVGYTSAAACTAQYRLLCRQSSLSSRAVVRVLLMLGCVT